VLAGLQNITRRWFISGLGLGLAGAAFASSRPTRWAVVYAGAADAVALSDYDLVVLDADRYPPLQPLRARGRTVLSYLSLTQAGRHRAFFDGLVRSGVVGEVHPSWPDSHYLDFRRPEWTKLILDELIPKAIERGFGGLLLDTLDDAEHLERTAPEKNAGMRQAAIRLVQAIRQQYPSLILMMNRGYGLLPELAGSIDVLLGESVVASFNAATKAYVKVVASDVDWQVNALKDAVARNPRLTVCTLDYWDPSDLDGIRQIYRDQRARGFVPYVSTPLLDRLIPEPR
jgi:uncharacterized protein (TIGR01370 family)